jgi:cyclohexanecarboxylate-CoA ligase
MPRGLTFEQIGVTEAMIATYADAVWALSNNIQVRRGDPIRKLDFAAFEAQRPDLGMSDGQIAAALGLTRDQVLAIRVVTEVRRFRRRNYHRLYALGRGNRYRADRYVAPAERIGYRADALALREAVRFDPARVAEFVRSGLWADDTLTRWLASRVADCGARAALSGPGGEVTYAELAGRAERFAGGLCSLGIGRGDVVSVQLPNVPEFVVAYLAIARLGAVMSTVHMPYRDAELRTLLAHSRARAFICVSATKDYAPAAAALAMRPGLPALEHVIALGEPVEGTISYATLGPRETALPDDIAPAPADPFLLLYTSGTSASPKAVPLTYQAMLGNARRGAPEHGITAADTILSAPPYTHLFGLYSFHLALATGARNLLLPAFTAPDLARAIATGRPTVLFTGPAHLAALQKTGLLESTDLSSIRLVICSGSACPPGLARAVAAGLPNGRFTQLWGMTETQAGLYTRPADPLEVSATTAGRPSPGTEVRVVAVDGTPLASGEEGEFQVRGSLMFPGYFDNAEANAGAFSDHGWFRTGDLAVIDAGGNVRITGRSKDLVNRGGVKYNPRDVEDLLDAHPGVMQAAIVPMPDPVVGEKACCFIVRRPGHAPTLDELCAYLLERGIAKYKLPERLESVAEMPLTPTRKIIKGRLAQMLADKS